MLSLQRFSVAVRCANLGHDLPDNLRRPKQSEGKHTMRAKCRRCGGYVVVLDRGRPVDLRRVTRRQRFYEAWGRA